MGWWYRFGGAPAAGFHGGFGWIGAFFGGLMMLVFLALLVMVVLWIVRGGGYRMRAGAYRGYGWHPARPAPDAALDILKERYAKGEIDRETYDRMRKDLSDEAVVGGR